MILIRSLVFNILFYVVLIGLMIIGLPLLLFSRHAVIRLAQTWGWCSHWLLRHVCGITCEFRGMDNIPQGAVLVACKHQSIWDTFSLGLAFADFTFILKRELTWIPLFGWYLSRAEQLAINRGSGASALEQIVTHAQQLKQEGRQLFIFPEGTRRPAGTPPRYKFGIANIYDRTGLDCLPVALNAGLFWQRRSFIRRPGKIVMEFLPVIPAGLPKQEFFDRLQLTIEDASNRLMAEAIEADPSLAAVLESGRD